MSPFDAPRRAAVPYRALRRLAADAVVPRIREAAATLRGWTREASGSVAGGLAEFAFEEAGLLVGAEPARIRAAEIEALERDAVALSARVDALASRG